MHTLVLIAVLHGVISISPIRVFSMEIETIKEFENDRYAECIKKVASKPHAPRKLTTDVSLRKKDASH